MRSIIIGQGITGPSVFRDHLIELLDDPTTVRCTVLVAFMTLNGILQIHAALQRFIGRPDTTLEWIVGIGLVTTPESLEHLHTMVSLSQRAHAIRVFSSTQRFFHPKVYVFERSDGTGTVLVGSNNVTPGGLSGNLEISARLEDLSVEEVAVWKNVCVVVTGLDGCHVLDEGLLARLCQELRQTRTTAGGRRLLLTESRSAGTTSSILIRQVPLAGDRTSQVHFSRGIIEDYFGCRLDRTEHLRFQEVKASGITGPIEERQIVYSQVNRNPKIELFGARILSNRYPRNGSRPILVFERVEGNFYRYMPVLPGDAGFSELSQYMSSVPQRGRTLKYDIVDPEKMLDVWPGYPM